MMLTVLTATMCWILLMRNLSWRTLRVSISKRYTHTRLQRTRKTDAQPNSQGNHNHNNARSYQRDESPPPTPWFSGRQICMRGSLVARLNGL